MSNQLYRIHHSKNVELPVDSQAKTRFLFSDSVLLLDKVLLYGFAYSTPDVTSDFRPVLDDTQSKQAYITLAGYKNEQYAYKLPILLLHEKWGTRFNQSIDVFPTPIFLKPRLISIRNSFVEIPAIDTWINFPATGYGMVFTFFYELYDERKHKLDDQGILINDDHK